MGVLQAAEIRTMPQGGVGIHNFNDTKVCNSPRTLEACGRQGILPEELVYKPVESFHEPGLESWAVQKRFDHAEHKRQEKIKAVQREHKRVDREFNGLDPNASSMRS